MYKHLFGPVPSRRLGMSLGIDLIPKKVCSLNCVYCEVGKTTDLTIDRLEYVKYESVITELERFMGNNPKIDYFTFSGSGEPTLNSRIGDVLKFIKEKYPKIKTAILTNGTLLYDKNLRKELLAADVILPSLDAASRDVFRKINRPSKKLNIEAHIQGLVDLRKEYKGEIWLEIFLLKGYNDTKEELKLLKETILRIKPDIVQLNTLDRPGTRHDLIPLTKMEMHAIVDLWELPNIEIIASPDKRSCIESYNGDIETAIMETIARRPCTLDDLHNFLGIHSNEINKYLGNLESSDIIETVNLERGVFYELKHK
ncbi:radical SAM protein [Maribacter sp. ANRC-HE7]|uniref:Radical SAM protein n=1 Tax=Maribacter aquimaris TaxID=2737171 RepID=A0ABR7UY69_9FLAO|nr:radical SAM protein [Maribacter aquimaris]MBD0777540.1 radical SAM protein [Maribacter aquimaris]